MSALEATPDHTPLIEALLTLPPEGRDGRLAICSNSMASGQVFNELGESERNQVPVIGTMIVSRDGAERMIINALSDPTVSTIVLFGEEGQSFAPSSNLLLALMNGVDETDGSNRIVGGLGSAAAYPNLNIDILATFREHIVVLPIFTSKRPSHQKVLAQYLEWLKPRVPREVLSFLEEQSPRKKIYFDVLNDCIDLAAGLPEAPKQIIELDPQAFRNLQPPKIEVPPSEKRPRVNFSVDSGPVIEVNLKLGPDIFTLHGNDEFDLSYSLMRVLGERKSELTGFEQLLLGAEIGRAGTLMRNADLDAAAYTTSDIFQRGEILPLQPIEGLKTDKDYYYKVAVRDGEISVMCMAHDTCVEVFDLRSTSVIALVERLAELDRFEPYEMDVLHRLDIGAQIGRAGIALEHGLQFMQDFPLVFSENTTDFPFRIVGGDNFLSVHKSILTSAYTEGITERHADEAKGPARSLGVLAVFRSAPTAFATMPRIYQQGTEPTQQTRAAYRDQLLRRDHDGDYSYGERTQVHFGVDQLAAAIEGIRADEQHAFVVQRYDPSTDMDFEIDERGGRHYTHDPCLTNDIYWVSGNGKLQSFHLARAHNLVNAYPENIFGLHDAYATRLAAATDRELGDMFVLSSRGNVLLLTEEQRLKSIVVEPSKPQVLDIDQSAGPIDAHFYGKTTASRFLAFDEGIDVLDDLEGVDGHPVIEAVRNYGGRDLITWTADYLQARGISHNNPIISSFYPGRDDPQSFSMPFFQANVFGGKLQTTAVFANPVPEARATYQRVCSYIASSIAAPLGVPTAPMNIVYVPF